MGVSSFKGSLLQVDLIVEVRPKNTQCLGSHSVWGHTVSGVTQCLGSHSVWGPIILR